MLLRVRSNVGLWRVDGLPDDGTATVQDLIDGIARCRPGAVVRPGSLSLDPACSVPLDASMTLSEQNLGHGSMVHCRVVEADAGGSAIAAAAAMGSAGAARPAAAAGGVPAALGGGLPPTSGASRVGGPSLRAPAPAPARAADGGYEGGEGHVPTCRICLCEGISGPDSPSSDPDERLISPCLCRGTIRYVHVGCLNQWRRSSHGRPDSALRCDQCGHTYDVRQTALALFLMSDRGAAAVAALGLALAVHLLGLVGYVLTAEGARASLYRWMRLGGPYRQSRWLIETAYGEVLTLGGAALGVLTFARYVVARTAQHYRWYREGAIDPARFQSTVALMAMWIYTETVQSRTGRGLAVVGLFMACYHSYEGAMVKAKHAAQWLGETIIEPGSAAFAGVDRQRQERLGQPQGT